jgi:hypothetical protein
VKDFWRGVTNGMFCVRSLGAALKIGTIDFFSIAFSAKNLKVTFVQVCCG